MGAAVVSATEVAGAGSVELVAVSACIGTGMPTSGSDKTARYVRRVSVSGIQVEGKINKSETRTYQRKQDGKRTCSQHY